MIKMTFYYESFVNLKFTFGTLITTFKWKMTLCVCKGFTHHNIPWSKSFCCVKNPSKLIKNWYQLTYIMVQLILAGKQNKIETQWATIKKFLFGTWNFIDHLHPNFETMSWIIQFAIYLFEFWVEWYRSQNMCFWGSEQGGLPWSMKQPWVIYSNPAQ